MRIETLLQGIDYALCYVAKEKQIWEKSLNAKGIEVEYIEFQSAQEVNDAFISGQVDFGIYYVDYQ